MTGVLSAVVSTSVQKERHDPYHDQHSPADLLLVVLNKIRRQQVYALDAKADQQINAENADDGIHNR